MNLTNTMKFKMPMAERLKNMTIQRIPAGDAVKMTTGAMGVRPCGGCEKRRQWMNQHLPRVPMPVKKG